MKLTCASRAAQVAEHGCARGHTHPAAVRQRREDVSDRRVEGEGRRYEHTNLFLSVLTEPWRPPLLVPWHATAETLAFLRAGSTRLRVCWRKACLGDTCAGIVGERCDEEGVVCEVCYCILVLTQHSLWHSA